MRPTFLGFEMGRKGLAVSQKALDITGHNLSNISTPGYTRQRIDQVSVSAYGYKARFSGSRTDFAGQGVTITGVSQTRNAFLDSRFRAQFSENFYYQQKADILSDISSVVDQYAASDGGLVMAINKISDALQGLSGDKATDLSALNIFHTSVQGMVQTLHDYSTKLDRVAEQHRSDLKVSVDDVNGMLAKIAGLNEQIINEIGVNTTDVQVYGPNELLDERNLLLDELSRYGDVHIKNEDDGSITVSLGDHVAVKGGKYDTLSKPGDYNGYVSLTWQSNGKDLDTLSGSLKAAVEMINGVGPDIRSTYESTEKGIRYYKERLDTFAQAFANMMNSVLPGALGDNGAADPASGYKTLLGAAVVDPATGKVTTDPTAEITAKNITISDQWTASMAYAFPSETSLKNSDFFQKMNTLLKTDSSTIFKTRSITYTGSFQEYLGDWHNTCVGEESFNQGRLDATGAVADNLLNERDSVSGVNKDEETSDMMMYQRSFQAVSRLMTAMDDMLDQIINRMGRVGL